MSKVLLLIVGLLLAPYACLPASAQQGEGLFLKIDKLTSEVVEAVARIGEERLVAAKAGTDLLKLVSQYCGTANARRSYLRLFIAANAEVDDVKTGRTVTTKETELKLPACIYSDERVVAVPVDRLGPRWDKPIAPSAQTVHTLAMAKAAAAPAGSGSTETPSPVENAEAEREGQWFVKWNPFTQYLATAKSADQLPSQTLDTARLAAASTRRLPDELNKLGISLTGLVDSKRLEEANVKDHYDRLVRSVLASMEKGDDAWKSGTVQLASLERAFRTQDILASNATADFTKLPTGASLLSSDFTPGTYHVNVKPGLEVKTAALQLGSAIKGTNPNAEIDIPSSKYVPNFASPQTKETAEACTPVSGQQWPFNAADLKKVLELRKLIKRPPKFGRILILDAGFPPAEVGKPPFEKRYFLPDASTPPDEGSQPYLWTQTIDNGKPVYYVPGLKFSGHGVEVLTLALGGVETLNQKLLESGVALEDGHIIALMGYSGSSGVLVLRGQAIASSIDGTRGEREIVNVVNLSLSFQTERDHISLSNSVKRRSQVLFVFAAGNEAAPLVRQHPAIWGGAASENAITVGASRPDGDYASFSNYNPQKVDLAAPGCGVPTLTWDDSKKTFEPTRLDGTSLAAPLVSFAANMLHGDYGGRTGRLKARLISSGRYSQDVATKAWSGRVLDIPVAVAGPFDALRMKDGSLRLGRIEWPESGRVVCGAMRSREEIRQIHAANSDVSQVSILYNTDDLNGVTLQPACPLATGELAQISFKEALVNAGEVKLGPLETLDMRSLNSITFCDNCAYLQ